MITSPIQFSKKNPPQFQSEVSDDYLKRLNYSKMEVIIKITERCNINCSYCYFFNDENQDFSTHPAYMAESTIEALAQFLSNATKKTGIKTLQLDLHGGEPMLLKKQRFARLCQIFYSHLSHIDDLRIAIQTNAMLVDNEWIDIFAKYKISVGVSIDGTPEHHDEYRVDHQGNGTYSRTLQGLNVLLDAQQRGLIQVAILCVINPERSAKEIFDHFVFNLGVNRLHFLMPDKTHDNFAPESLDAFSNFLKELFDAWISCSNKNVQIRLLNQVLGLLSSSRACLDEWTENKRKFLAFSVGSNGDLGPNDEFRNIEQELFRTGLTVFNAQIQDLLFHPLIARFNSELGETAAKCSECCWKNICNSGDMFGCAVHRHSKKDHYKNPSVYCKPANDFLTHVATYAVTRGVKVENIEAVLSF